VFVYEGEKNSLKFFIKALEGKAEMFFGI